MPADYTALDAAILYHIQVSTAHPWPAMARHYELVPIKLWQRPRTIARRLQVLRRAGKVRYSRSTGWMLANG